MSKKITRRQAPARARSRAADLLQDEAEIAAYIKSVLLDGDDRAVLKALRAIRNDLLRLQHPRRMH